MTKPPPEFPKAVALSYDRQSHSAPTIIAKGKGEIAKQILDIAFANGIKVREDADLIQLLDQFELETQIPVDAFLSVAEILNYVYQLNGSENKITPDFGMKGE